MIGILESRELRVGAYKEVMKVRVAKVRTWDKKSKKYRVDHDVMQTLESAPVCCLADIPIMHLSYHAGRYGQFAIGFHREAALRAGFNPGLLHIT
jgi:abortive phage resistance protein AbiGi (putative antitoxin)